MMPENLLEKIKLYGIIVHGGQVTLFGIHPLILPLYDDTYWKGYYQLDNFDLLISNGVGVYRYPVRFFARPSFEVLIL